ncbi:LysM peptidoglycan-binding domain-containing protein [Pectobacterium polaris]|uniref:LysM peptidoglycan-binding domain-containing protein n=1 Tax=Pectobacterium polaris TaxID=2042057 RepID=UPI001F30EB81|nr:LysM peptidoglycan-binding domain-containing protein [Pectobacterium polaris]
MNIQDLWTSLHTNGYLNDTNTTLSLPADNQLGSAPLTALLTDSTLFPTASLQMALSSATPPGTVITLVGTLTGTFMGFKDPAATAIFSVDNTGTVELSLAVTLGNGQVLGIAFPKIEKDVPGQYAFTGAVMTAASAQTGSTLTFSGVPVPPKTYANLWASPLKPVTGSITRWADPSTTPPDFALANQVVKASAQAGLLTFWAGIALTSSSTGGAGSLIGEIPAGQLAAAAVPMLSLLPGNDGTGPVFDTADGWKLNIPDLSSLAALFVGTQLAAFVPPRFPLGSALNVTHITISLAYGGAKTLVMTNKVVEDVGVSLLPLNAANLESIEFTFSMFLSDALTLSIGIGGNFYFFNNKTLSFYAGVSVPSLIGNIFNNNEIDVSELLGTVGITGIPQTGCVFDTISGTVDVNTGYYAFTGNASFTGSNWSINLGSGLTLIEIDSLGVTLTKSAAVTTSELTTSFVFLGSQFYASAYNSSNGGGWLLTGYLSPDTPMKIADVARQLLPWAADAVPDITVNYLECQFDTSNNTYMVNVGVMWKLDILPISITADFMLKSSRVTAQSPAQYSGYVRGIVDINGMLLGVAYVFDPTTTDISFSYKSLTVTYHQDKVDNLKTYVAVSLNNSNVGDLFSFLLEFASPGRNISLSSPWDVLEKIGLPNLTVKVYLQTKNIEVDIDLDVDLGFMKLTKFVLIYQRQYGKAKFDLQLSGNFLGQDYGQNGASPLSWDPLNEAPPVVPGTGTQTFDLEYLGLGQRLALREIPPATMDGVIAALEKALVPTGNPQQNPATQLPGLTYDAGSNWLIGTRFTAMSTVQLSVVFNDPYLYGLLIQLSGSRAGALAGLRFEVLYRKISDSIGVYHIELTLPDAMRHIEMGEVSITLPIVTIDIYTNGNFRIDVGFPPSLTDFSRSGSVQVFPFIGYGGFYFAVLNGTTSSSVPTITNGTFSPVLELGLALQVGVGKTISLGILSGGISITVGGQVQGVLAWFNPTPANLSPERYIHLRGTVAVVGIVYATVDFGIIQASVNLTVYASVSLDVESYKAILIEISAGVSVRVSIKIVFIRIHFSFSATITESFTIGNDTAPPWLIASGSNANTLLAGRRSYRSRARTLRQKPYSKLRSRPARNLQKRGFLLRRSAFGLTASTTLVDLTALPLISQALPSDFGFPGAPTFPGTQMNPVLALLLGMETSSEPASGTNQFLNFVTDWVVDAMGHVHDTVSAALIDEILDALSADDVASTVFTYPALVNLFTSNNIQFSVTARPTTDPGTDVPMALMAMIPELSMTTPDFSINFLTDRIPQGDYELTIQQYFADLAAQFAAREDSPTLLADELGAIPDSMAVIVFRYYFQMLAKGLMQQAKTLLSNMALTLDPSTAAAASLISIANLFTNNYTVRAGDTLASIAPLFGITEADLQAANPDDELTEPKLGQTLFIPTNEVSYTSQTGDTLAGLSACFGVSQADLQTANPSVDFSNLPAGTTLTIPAMRILHTVIADESGASIAADFGIGLGTLEAANPTVDFNPLATGTVLLIPLQVTADMVATGNEAAQNVLNSAITLSLGDITFTAQSTDSINALAAQFGVSVEQLINTNQESLTLINPGQSVPLGDLTTTTRAGDSYNSLVNYWYGRVVGFEPSTLNTANPGLTLTAGQTLSIPSSTATNQGYLVVSGDTFDKIAAANPGLTLSDLMANNAAIGVDVPQTVKLPGVTVPTSNSFILSYAAAPGDTLTTIAAQFFAPDDLSQQTALQSLQQWNGKISTTDPLIVGQIINVPYATAFGSIERQYKVTAAQIAASSAMGTASLLAARASLTAPNVVHQINATDTLGSIAQTYDLSLEQLTDRIARVTGLFAAASDPTIQLSIVAIPGMRLSVLTDNLASMGMFTDALNMTSRFMMSGLRAPAPQFADEPAPSKTTAYPLYAMIGQEYPLGTVTTGYDIKIGSSGASWVAVQPGAADMPLLPQEIAQITAFQTLGFQPNVLQSIALPQFAYTADSQTVGAVNLWKTPEIPVDIVPSGQKVVQPSLWTLPDALVSALAASPTGTLLYQPKSGTTQPDGSIKSTVLENACYATSISIDIQTVPNTPDGIYMVAGADQAGMQRLLALWEYLTSNSETATIYIAYADQDTTNASTSGGTLVSDKVNRANSFILKTNLSTESHGAPQTTLQGTRIRMLNTGLLDSPLANLDPDSALDFLQLLWECSVVKSGGYYLRYETTDGTLGLPANLFSGGTQATIQIIVVTDNQVAGSPVAYAYNNIALIGDNVDTGSHNIFFEALTHEVTASDTLTSIAQVYSPWVSLTPVSLAELNQTVVGSIVPGTTITGTTGQIAALATDSFLTLALRAGVTVAAMATEKATTTGWLQPGNDLQLSGNPVQIVAFGDTLASLSQEYDFLDPEALATLNLNMPGLLAVSSVMTIPNQADYIVQTGDTFGSIARALGVDLSLIAEENQEAAILAVGQPIVVGGGTLNLTATLPQGHIGFDVIRTDPQPQDPTNETDQAALNTLFNLLGFQIDDTAALKASNEGLPAGPTTENDDDPWDYQQVMSILAFAKVNHAIASEPLPSPSQNPYAGISVGAMADVALFFQDVLGNRTNNSTLTTIVQPLGYTDEMVSLTAWPSATTAYRFAPLVSGTDNLTVTLSISPTQFLPDTTPLQMIAGAPSATQQTAAAVRAGSTLATYQTLSYQLQQPDVTGWLSTTLGSIGDAENVGETARIRLLGAANAAYVFMTGARDLKVEPVTLGNSGYLNVAALINEPLSATSTGYPTSSSDVGQYNAAARADLLWGQGTPLSIPSNYLVLSGDTPQAIVTASQGNVDLARLADQNAVVPVAQDAMVNTAVRTATVGSADLSLSAIALQIGTLVVDGPGKVPGLVTPNAKVALTEGLTLSYSDTTGQYSYEIPTGGTFKDAAADFTAQVRSHSGDQSAVVSVLDVASANEFLDNIWPLGTSLSISSVVTNATDTLTSLANDFGTPAGGTGSPEAQFLTGNAEVPGVWAVHTALFIQNITVQIAEGNTLADIAAEGLTSVGSVLSSNPAVSFLDTAVLAIPYMADNPVISASVYGAAGTETMNAVVAKYPDWSLDGLAVYNGDVPGLFAPTEIDLNGKKITPTVTATINALAIEFGLTVSAFMSQIAALPGIIANGAAFVAPAMTSVSGDTLKDVATRYNVGTGALAAACASLPGFLPKGESVTVENTPYPTYANDTFGLLTARINAARQINNLKPIGVSDVGVVAGDVQVEARTLLAPPLGTAVSATVTPAKSKAVLSLGVTLTMSRDPALLAPAFAGAPHVVSARTDIPAQPFSGSGDAGQASLTQFGIDFEATFPGLKIATGPAATQTHGTTQIKKPSLKLAVTANPSSSTGGKTLWVVNFSNEGVGITYEVDRSGIRYFGVTPLSTVAWNNTVEVPTYSSDKGLSWTGKQQAFRAADPDAWNQAFLTAIDLLLSPAYAVPGSTDATVAANIASVIGSKADIATGMSSIVAPIIGTDTTGLTEAQTTLKQQLLTQLSSAYSVQTLVQVDLDVQGSGAGSDPTTAPQLSGKLVAGIVRTPDDTDDTSAAADPSQPFAPLAIQAQVSQRYLAETIEYVPSIIRTGLTVSYTGAANSYTTTGSDTVATLAAFFKVTAGELPAGMTLASNDGPLFQGSTAINITPFVVPVPTSGYTVTYAANWMNVEVEDIINANAERTGFFATGSTVTVDETSYTPNATDSLETIANQFGGQQRFADSLAEIDAGTLPGGYTLNSLAPPRGIQNVPQMSIATAKGALSTTGSRITTLFGVKDPAVQKSVVLNLDYQVSQMEIDIHSIDGIQGYKSSSWLNFIIPIVTGADTDGDIGQVQVPVLLRGYPEPTLVSNQVAGNATTTQDPVKVMAQWNYGFATQRRYAAQDALTLEVRFNQTSDDMDDQLGYDAAPKYESVIEVLAAFSAVWPAISADLAQLPDTTGGVSSPIAANAVSALADLATRLQNAWRGLQATSLGSGLPEKSFKYLMSTLSRGGNGIVSGITLDRLSQATDFSVDPDDFLFVTDALYQTDLNTDTVPTALATEFKGFGFALSGSETIIPRSPGNDNTDWLIVDPSASQSILDQSFQAPQTYRLMLSGTGANAVIKVYRQLLWPGLMYVPSVSSQDETSRWLNASQAGTRLSFTLDTDNALLSEQLEIDYAFYRLDLLLLQNASGGTSVSRNANLIAGATINPLFVYNTPMVKFPTRITPLLSHTETVSMPGANLTAALSNFFETLVSSQTEALPGTTRQMRIGATYWQSSDGVTAPTATSLSYRNPLVLAPLVEFNVDTDWEASGLVGTLSDAMQSNASAMGITPQAPGVWVLDVLVYSYIVGTDQPTGILDIQNQIFPA